VSQSELLKGRNGAQQDEGELDEGSVCFYVSLHSAFHREASKRLASSQALGGQRAPSGNVLGTTSCQLKNRGEEGRLVMGGARKRKVHISEFPKAASPFIAREQGPRPPQKLKL